MTAVDALISRAEPLDGPVDLLDAYGGDGGFVLERHGRGVATVGEAVRIPVPAGPGQVWRAAVRAREALERIGQTERPPRGPAPIVVGALPFDGMTPATLTVPATATIRDRDGRVWRLSVGDGTARTMQRPRRDASSLDGGVVPRVAAADATDLETVPEPHAYVAAVAEARRRIRCGDLEKVVLARMLVARAERDIDRTALLRRLREREPDAYTFAVHGFVGASPELLVERRGRRVRSLPLAGTVPRSAEPDEDRAAAERLLGSRKDLAEHAPVVDAVRSALAPACERLDAEVTPSLLATGAVWHLATAVHGTLRAPAPTAMDLAALLHPTPAVCGTPRATAMATIRELESIDRTLYAGIVGWMDADGDGEWAVVLRCAEIQGRLALLFAGAGIVADSEPVMELAETAAKFGSMLGALGYA
jgi:isochorismate synthase